MIMCGGDEAGRGALVGPLVIALVSMKKSMIYKLPELGVRDSKLLSSKRREQLYDSIMDIAEEVNIGKITPGEINDAMRSNISLNELEAIHFARLFDKSKIPIDALYLDSPDVIQEKFGIRINILSIKPTLIPGMKRSAAQQKSTKLISEHKADSRYPVVSAASIIAKVERDKEIRKLSKSLKIDIGSGYPSDYKTIDSIRNNIKNENLNKYVRAYWKTIDNIKQTKLFDVHQND
ncbi:MAG: ribonuclease HII [Candidatus Marsarchaeota archaeon]|nr:ribonuclease HII [Candidatus Marsarchaeota archaeon]